MADRAITLGGNAYPVILPSIRDPRLGIAAVVLSLHALGQLGLHFWVSVPQILAAMFDLPRPSTFAVEFRRRRAFVWPASALLTGSGVALLMRVVGTPTDHPWATNDLLLFAGVAAFSLLSKYVVRYRGKNLLNPSNFGLVVAFLVFGNARLEPLALWWSPLNAWMIAAYAIILVGGTYVVWRAKMMTITATFFVTFIVLQGAPRRIRPLHHRQLGVRPRLRRELLVDDRHVAGGVHLRLLHGHRSTDRCPAGRVGRIVFALCVGVSDDAAHGAADGRVRDQGGAARRPHDHAHLAHPMIDRLVPEGGLRAHDTFRAFATRLATGGRAGLRRPVASDRRGWPWCWPSSRGASWSARHAGPHARSRPTRRSRWPRSATRSNPDTLPPITVSQSVQDWDSEIAGSAPQLMVLLAQNLAVESQALRRVRPQPPDRGRPRRPARPRCRPGSQSDSATGTCVVDVYTFDSVNVTLIVPFGVQSGLSLGYDARGTVTHETYDSSGHLVSSQSSPFANTFAIRRATGARWLNVAVLPPGTGT